MSLKEVVITITYDKGEAKEPEVQIVSLTDTKQVQKLLGPMVNNEVIYNLKKHGKHEVTTALRSITYELRDQAPKKES